MMKTISFRVDVSNQELQKVISEDSRVYSSMVRYSFNRFKEGNSIKEIYHKLGESFPTAKSHYRNCASRQAKYIFELNKDKKVHFGQFKRFQKGLITKEEYKDSKNLGVFSEGECPYKGNRFFTIDLQNNKFIYKRACKEHYDLIINENLSDKRRLLLSRIHSLAIEKKIPVTYKLKKLGG